MNDIVAEVHAEGDVEPASKPDRRIGKLTREPNVPADCAPVDIESPRVREFAQRCQPIRLRHSPMPPGQSG